MSYFFNQEFVLGVLDVVTCRQTSAGTNVDAELHLSLSDSGPWLLLVVPTRQQDKELGGGARAGVVRVRVGGSMLHVNESPASEFSPSQLFKHTGLA
jgi:hypothetical protein